MPAECRRSFYFVFSAKKHNIMEEIVMTFEEAFDYLRSLSSLSEDKIREVLTERSATEASEFILKDEDSGTNFDIRYTEKDGFIIDALFS
jgi:hypothetical protein